jgi:hypothetical protein
MIPTPDTAITTKARSMAIRGNEEGKTAVFMRIYRVDLNSVDATQVWLQLRFHSIELNIRMGLIEIDPPQ